MAELFDRFEVNRMPRWPLMSRLVALSVVLHGLFIVTLIYVPTLRNILYVAGSMAGIKFVNEDYDRTLIGQRATIVQLPPHEKLLYPPDYFGSPEVAETTLAPEPSFVQQVAPPPVVYRPRRVRTPKAAEAQPSPSPASNEVAQAAASPSPTPSPTPDEAQKKEAQAEADKIAKEKGLDLPAVNTKPFEDIAVKGKELIEQGKLNLNSTIEVTAVAERNDDGTLKPETVKIDWVSASDENMALLAQQLITALSQSKVLVVLSGAKDVRMVLKLDQQNVSVKIMSEFASEEIAQAKAEGYEMVVGWERRGKQGTNEGELYNNLKFSSEGKLFTMSFEMPKEAAGKMIAEILAKKAAKEAAATQKKS